uniref:Uncharacterized protein LOC108049778 n=1 Tax=Drosophila rhopaloa TaxID=1041015 RepID=A0A6P4F822_DRORH
MSCRTVVAVSCQHCVEPDFRAPCLAFSRFQSLFKAQTVRTFERRIAENAEENRVGKRHFLRPKRCTRGRSFSGKRDWEKITIQQYKKRPKRERKLQRFSNAIIIITRSIPAEFSFFGKTTRKHSGGKQVAMSPRATTTTATPKGKIKHVHRKEKVNNAENASKNKNGKQQR